MAAVTLEQFAQFINTTVPPTDPRAEELTRVLQAATRTVEARVGPLEAATASWRVRQEGRLLLLPAVRVAALEGLTGPGGQALGPEALAAVVEASDLPSGVVYLPGSAGAASGHPGAASPWWQATARVGFDPIPDDLLLAVLIVAGHLWETQRGTAARPGIMGEDRAGFGGRGYAIPYRAQTLMDPYLLPSDLARA